MLDKIKNERFSRKILYLLTQMEGASESTITELFDLAGFKPDVKSLVSFISKFLLSLGVLFTISGVIFFFAYNWRELHKFVKLSIVGSLIIVPASIALLSDLRKFYSKLTLMVTAIFIGCLLAVFGQIYQTGANAYDLFLNWAFLISGIVLISNFKPLWFIWLGLINTAIILYAGQILRHWIDPYAFITLLIVDTIALLSYEYLSIRKVSGFNSRWLPRMLGFTIVITITVAAIFGIVTDFKESGHFICLALAILSYVGVFYLYSHKILDLSTIAVSCICIIAVIFSAILKTTDFDVSFMFFIGGFIIIGLTIASALILMKINETWKTKT